MTKSIEFSLFFRQLFVKKNWKISKKKKSSHRAIKNDVKNVQSKFQRDSLKTVPLRVETVLKNTIPRKTRLKFGVRNFQINRLLTINRRCQVHTIFLLLPQSLYFRQKFRFDELSWLLCCPESFGVPRLRCAPPCT